MFDRHDSVSIEHGIVSIKHTFMSIKHTFMSIKHTFMSIKHTFMSNKHTFMVIPCLTNTVSCLSTTIPCSMNTIPCSIDMGIWTYYSKVKRQCLINIASCSLNMAPCSLNMAPCLLNMVPCLMNTRINFRGVLARCGGGVAQQPPNQFYLATSSQPIPHGPQRRNSLKDVRFCISDLSKVFIFDRFYKVFRHGGMPCGL